MVDDAAALAHGVEIWLADPQAALRAGARGQRWMAENRGAVDRLWAVIEPYLAGNGPACGPVEERLAGRPAQAQ
jgi:hypothetical protein